MHETSHYPLLLHLRVAVVDPLMVEVVGDQLRVVVGDQHRALALPEE